MTLMELWSCGKSNRVESIKVKSSPKKWTEEEEQFLIDNYKELRVKGLAVALNRTTSSIEAKVEKLRCGGFVTDIQPQWSDEDTKFLKSNYMDMNNNAIARVLGRTPSSVQSKLSYMGLRRSRVIDRSAWTDSEEGFLVENYNDLGAGGVAEKTGRSIWVVMEKVRELRGAGVALKNIRKKWNDIEDDFLVENWSSKSINDLADNLDRSYFSVYKRMRLLGFNGVKEE